MSPALQIELIREQMGEHLRPLDKIRAPDGLATGVDVFDDFLTWRGLPKGDLTLLQGPPGTGATSLWMQTTKKVHEQGKWCAWINSDWELMPHSLAARQVDLSKLLIVQKPESNTQLFWALQELLSSCLFEMVGCHLPQQMLKDHQLIKLKKLARQHHVALVFVSHAKMNFINPLFSLVIDCQMDFFTIRRALHRPVPLTISGSSVYADLMPQLSNRARVELC